MSIYRDTTIETERRQIIIIIINYIYLPQFRLVSVFISSWSFLVALLESGEIPGEE